VQNGHGLARDFTARPWYTSLRAVVLLCTSFAADFVSEIRLRLPSPGRFQGLDA
jgi:hypothetical protein